MNHVTCRTIHQIISLDLTRTKPRTIIYINHERLVDAHAYCHDGFSRSHVDKVNIKIHCDNKTVILQSTLGRVPSFEVTLGRLRLQNRTSKSSRCKICKKYEPLSWRQSTVGLGCLLSQLIIVMVPH